MIEFLAWSGLRIAELQSLRWEDVSETWLTVTGGEKGTKNMEERRVPINMATRSHGPCRHADGGRPMCFRNKREK
jgi:site-specific recombinase XerC